MFLCGGSQSCFILWPREKDVVWFYERPPGFLNVLETQRVCPERHSSLMLLLFVWFLLFKFPTARRGKQSLTVKQTGKVFVLFLCANTGPSVRLHSFRCVIISFKVIARVISQCQTAAHMTREERVAVRLGHSRMRPNEGGSTLKEEKKTVEQDVRDHQTMSRVCQRNQNPGTRTQEPGPRNSAA